MYIYDIYIYNYIYVYIICMSVSVSVSVYVSVCLCLCRHMLTYTDECCSGGLRACETGSARGALQGRYDRYSVYLLYWYKITNADATRAPQGPPSSTSHSVYLIYWYKNTNADATRAPQGPSSSTSFATPTRAGSLSGVWCSGGGMGGVVMLWGR